MTGTFLRLYLVEILRLGTENRIKTREKSKQKFGNGKTGSLTTNINYIIIFILFSQLQVHLPLYIVLSPPPSRQEH